MYFIETSIISGLIYEIKLIFCPDVLSTGYLKLYFLQSKLSESWKSNVEIGMLWSVVTKI